MGLSPASGYTRRMTPTPGRSFASGDLIIRPESGQVTNSRGESARFGPVNMKVLATLLDRAGEIVSRGEIYDAVWGNQLVGEDALTRAISDIRAELRKLADGADLIETLPKRGYRWIGPAGNPAQAAAAVPADPGGRPDEAGPGAVGPVPPPPARLARWTAALRRLVAWGLALVVAATLAVWLMDRLLPQRRAIVAVLPVAAGPDHRALAERVELELGAYLLRLGTVDILAPSAVEAGPPVPYPFFALEFGARWIVESELRTIGERVAATTSLVDARTGIVLRQMTIPVNMADTAPVSFAALGAAIDAELAGRQGRPVKAQGGALRQ